MTTPENVAIEVTACDGQRVSVPLRNILDAIKEFSSPAHSPKARIIKEACTEYFDLSESDICSMRRTANVVYARQIAMYLIREMAPYSLPQIGRQFGDRDHTTVLHAVNKIAAWRKTRPEVDIDVSRLKAIVAARIEGRTTLA